MKQNLTTRIKENRKSSSKHASAKITIKPIKLENSLRSQS